MTTTSYLALAEKTSNTTRHTADEYNELKDALTDGTKGITTQCIKTKTASYTTSGALAIGGFASINSSGGTLALTLAAPPEAGVDQTICLVTAGNNAVVTLGSGVTYDGTNNTATFSTAGQTLILKSISTTRWVIVENIGTVTFSAV